MQNLKLANNKKIPQLGFGEFLISKENAIQVTIDALESGYRHIDTAESYLNEEEIGIAIKRSQINRELLFITTKIWVSSAGYQNTLKTIHNSLKKMQLDYLDMVLIHFPYGDYYGSWRAMEELYENGIIKAIGVCNFSAERLADLIWHSKIKPMVNQIEINPLIQRKEIIKFCHENNVVVEAFSPLGGQARINEIMNNKTLIKIAQAKNKSISQIIIRWLIQQSVVVLTKTVKVKRMKENLNVFDFELSTKEMNEINALDTNIPKFGEANSLEGIKYIKKITDAFTNNQSMQQIMKQEWDRKK